MRCVNIEWILKTINHIEQTIIQKKKKIHKLSIGKCLSWGKVYCVWKLLIHTNINKQQRQDEGNKFGNKFVWIFLWARKKKKEWRFSLRSTGKCLWCVKNDVLSYPQWKWNFITTITSNNTKRKAKILNAFLMIFIRFSTGFKIWFLKTSWIKVSTHHMNR